MVAELSRSILVRSTSIDAKPNSRLFGRSIGHLFLVADGMGGHRAGSEASSLAIEFFVASILNNIHLLIRAEPHDEISFTEDLKMMLEQAHRELQRQSKSSEALAGMGTTLTMAYIFWPRMYVVHAGDTRCYLMRNKQLRLLTRDHTVANQMMRMGRLDPDAAERSPWSNVLINALGAGAPQVIADIYKIDMQSEDQVLLCSDGLNKHVDDLTIEQTLNRAANANEACGNLVDLANQGGGIDNITVVVGKFVEPEHATSFMPIVETQITNERTLCEIEIPSEENDTDGDDTLRVSTMEFNPE